MDNDYWINKMHNLAEEDMSDSIKDFFFTSARHIRRDCGGNIIILGRYRNHSESNDITNADIIISACDRCNFRQWILSDNLKKSCDLINPIMFNSIMSQRGLEYLQAYINPWKEK